MSHHKEQSSELTQSEAVDRVWELSKDIDICMFVTWDGEYSRARPLSARVHREANSFYFLVNEEGAKSAQIERFPKVTMAWSDNDGYKYVTVSGRAQISNDRIKIEELWEKTDEAWWDTPQDPDIRLITVVPDDAELWGSPGKIVATVQMVIAAVTGTSPDIGDNVKVDL